MFMLLVFVICLSISSTLIYAHGIFSDPAKRDYHRDEEIASLPESFSYKEWCENNFANGSFIYEAYRQISFKINYVPEPPFNDFWQTPLETFYRCAGDCEDVVLYFNNILTEQFDDGTIAWGVVEDLSNNTEYAHVWFELHGRDGRVFIVEPFTKGWKGIIPIELLKNKRIKKKTISISCKLIRDLFRNHLKIDVIRKSIVRNETTFDQLKNRLINDILSRLGRVSRRYIGQNVIMRRRETEW